MMKLRHTRNASKARVKSGPTRTKHLIPLLIYITCLVLSLYSFLSFRGSPKSSGAPKGNVVKLPAETKKLPSTQASSKRRLATSVRRLFEPLEAKILDIDNLTRSRALNLKQNFCSLLSQADRFDKRRLENDAFSILAGDPANVEMHLYGYIFNFSPVFCAATLLEK